MWICQLSVVPPQADQLCPVVGRRLNSNRPARSHWRARLEVPRLNHGLTTHGQDIGLSVVGFRVSGFEFRISGVLGFDRVWGPVDSGSVLGCGSGRTSLLYSYRRLYRCSRFRDVSYQRAAYASTARRDFDELSRATSTSSVERASHSLDHGRPFSGLGSCDLLRGDGWFNCSDLFHRLADGGCEQVVHYPGVGDGGICEGFFAAVMGIFQTVVVEAQLVEDRGQEVGAAYSAFDSLITEVIGPAVDVAGLEAAAGLDQAERIAVVVAAVAFLGNRQTAELARPDHDRLDRKGLWRRWPWYHDRHE